MASSEEDGDRVSRGRDKPPSWSPLQTPREIRGKPIRTSEPPGFDPEATLIVTRHFGVGRDGTPVRPWAYALGRFSTAIGISARNGEAFRQYDGKLWPSRSKTEDHLMERDSGQGTIAIIQYDTPEDAHEALRRVTGGKHHEIVRERRDGYAQPQLDRDLRTLASHPGARVLYESRSETSMERAPERVGHSRGGLPDRQVMRMAAARLEATASGAPTIVAHLQVRKGELAEALMGNLPGHAPQSIMARALHEFTHYARQEEWEKADSGGMRRTGRDLVGQDALLALRDGFGRGTHRSLRIEILESELRDDKADVLDAAQAISKRRSQEGPGRDARASARDRAGEIAR